MSALESPDRPRRRILLIVAPVLALVALIAWGYSSPVGSAPDDDFHLVSIWCGGASAANECQPGAKNDERIVPRDLVFDAKCYSYKPAKSAACQGKDFGVRPQDTVSTDRGNFTGLYPPVFYFVMSVFAGPNIDVSVLAMRIFNSFLFVGWIVLLWFLIPPSRRRQLVIGFAVTLVPLGMSLIPSTNPSSWAILAGGTLWLALIGYFESTGWRRMALAGFAAVTLLIGAGARSDAAVFAGVAIVVAVVFTMRRERRYWLTALFTLGLLIIAILFFVSAQQSGAVSSGLGTVGTEPAAITTAGNIEANTILMPGLWVGIFGLNGWGIGWLDTPIPIAAGVGAFLVFAGVVFWGLRTGSWRKWIAVLTVVFAMWLFPAVLLLQTKSLVGAYVQPRYILPLMTILAGVILMKVVNDPLSRPQRLVAVVALSIANSLAMALNMRRYITGTDVIGLNLNSHAEWWWPGFFLSPMAVWAIGTLAFAGALVALDKGLFGRGRLSPGFAVAAMGEARQG